MMTLSSTSTRLCALQDHILTYTLPYSSYGILLALGKRGVVNPACVGLSLKGGCGLGAIGANEPDCLSKVMLFRAAFTTLEYVFPAASK